MILGGELKAQIEGRKNPARGEGRDWNSNAATAFDETQATQEATRNRVGQVGGGVEKGESDERDLL